MPNVNLELSHESMDALFVDLLDDNLELILNPDVKFIHEDDYDNNLTLAHSIMSLMRYQKDAFVFEKWFADVYWPMLNKYTEKYEELTYEDEE
jgi:DNA-binding XRE family transcriptional regulator